MTAPGSLAVGLMMTTVLARTHRDIGDDPGLHPETRIVHGGVVRGSP
ncbi:MAG TPA: hypothetical protein VIQ30_03545 [Pseudonocardia sp.]